VQSAAQKLLLENAPTAMEAGKKRNDAHCF
jgi:hypothetical protein